MPIIPIGPRTCIVPSDADPNNVDAAPIRCDVKQPETNDGTVAAQKAVTAAYASLNDGAAPPQIKSFVLVGDVLTEIT